jgi:hypothetical protein
MSRRHQGNLLALRVTPLDTLEVGPGPRPAAPRPQEEGDLLVRRRGRVPAVGPALALAGHPLVHAGHARAALADAVEEAGGAAELLAHLRGPGPRWVGCWAVDVLMGR